MYKIILDSCGEIPKRLTADEHFTHVALELEVDGVSIRDDESFNQADFLKRIKESIAGPHSACPSPDAYMEKMNDEADHIYVVTLSSKLSGSYNSALVAAQLYEEEHEGEKKIYVFNSRSASIGETITALKIQECEEAGMSFEETVETVEKYVDSVRTYFVLETLETLRKAGRLSNLKAFIANTLNIKPIMGSTDEGAIQQLGQARGTKKALAKMVEDVITNTKDSDTKVLGIAHCNCPDRAEYVKELALKTGKFRDVVIVDTAGVSSMYANDGGIILAV